jgi:hypothetical protein
MSWQEITYLVTSCRYNYRYNGCSARRLIGQVINTQHSTIEASITLDGLTRTDSLLRWPPNEWPSVCRKHHCLPIRCSERLISLNNEHPIYLTYNSIISRHLLPHNEVKWPYPQQNCLRFFYSYLKSHHICIQRFAIVFPVAHLDSARGTQYCHECSKDGQMGEARSTHGKDEKNIQSFGTITCSNETLWRPSCPI